MASIDNKEMIEQLIAGNGRYGGDPQIVKIVEYTTIWGNKCWGVVYPQDHPDRYQETEYVRNPFTIWDRKNGDRRVRAVQGLTDYQPKDY